LSALCFMSCAYEYDVNKIWQKSWTKHCRSTPCVVGQYPCVSAGLYVAVIGDYW
jgi:hypothetical protein